MASHRVESIGHSRLLRISSEDRDKTSHPNPCEFDIHFQSSSKLHKIRRVVVRTVSFPNIMWNVSEVDGGNTMDINFSVSGFQSVSILQGQYDTDTLMTAVEDAINTLITPNTISLSQNDLTQKIEILLTGEDMDVSAGILASVLGIIQPATFTSGTPTPVESLPSLEGLTSTNLCTSFSQAHSIANNGRDSNILIDVPVYSAFGFENIYSPNDDELASITFANTIDMSSISIRLEDRRGRVVDIHGRELLIFLRVYYYP